MASLLQVQLAALACWSGAVLCSLIFNRSLPPLEFCSGVRPSSGSAAVPSATSRAAPPAPASFATGQRAPSPAPLGLSTAQIKRAILLGQLAIDQRCHGLSYARSLMWFALTRAVWLSRDIGGFRVLTHPLDEGCEHSAAASASRTCRAILLMAWSSA